MTFCHKKSISSGRVKTGAVQAALAIESFFFSLSTGPLFKCNSRVEGELFLKQKLNKVFINLRAPCAVGGPTE